MATFNSLEECDKAGKSTKFIEFILNAINESLFELLNLQNRLLTAEDRVDYFTSIYREESFTRKDYMNIFRDISTSTASRDLKYAVGEGFISKEGKHSIQSPAKSNKGIAENRKGYLCDS